ncbi:hypothetical protein SCHPADRAFT_939611 [Schizopora paradoxa]|uniref:Uncharacterized protein n=1 Tax=Schizopora paradoxa TaxID=27342 RepID=A0A0H2RXT1_9AGAM|nr:hypothetical protein SCHPADRAFT_939611 [Schizopora paradoxa]
MVNNDCNDAGSRPRAQEIPDDSPTVDDIPGITRISSSFLDELWEDNSTNVYTSSWSSNYTMSNLPGPGRNLGNFYSWVGASLERRLTKRAEQAAVKKYGNVASVLKSDWGIYDKFMSDDVKEHEKACEIVLICAESDDANLQVDAFVKIERSFVLHPLKVRTAFQNVFERRKQIADVVTLSWKRPGGEYTVKWLFLYKLASRCLASHQGEFVKAATQFYVCKYSSLNFSHFEELLVSCADATDLLIAVQFVAWYWHRNDVNDYVQNRGFEGPAIVKFAIGLITHWEVHFSQPEATSLFLFSPPFYLTMSFIYGMMLSLKSSVTNVVNELFQDNGQLTVWVDVFKLHHFVRRYYSKLFGKEYPLVSKSWGELCLENLPKDEHTNLRHKMLHLEDVLGGVMRKRLPPQIDSAIDREEKAKSDSVSL